MFERSERAQGMMLRSSATSFSSHFHNRSLSPLLSGLPRLPQLPRLPRLLCSSLLMLRLLALSSLLLVAVRGDLNFDRFSSDPNGEASHLRVIGGSSVDLFSTEFVETCDADATIVSLTSAARDHYLSPPCRGDEVEVNDGQFPGTRHFAICAPGPCSSDDDCPSAGTSGTSPSCTYVLASTGDSYCELTCSEDSDCYGVADDDAIRCTNGRCMYSITILDMNPPRSLTQRHELSQFRRDTNYNSLPYHTYLDDGQLDNPYAGRVSEAEFTETVTTKDFVRDGDLTPLPHNRTQLCHYALRITPPERAKNTAVWSKFKQLVSYGFVTEFDFRILHRTKSCVDVESKASGWCSPGGSDGFAFVIQNQNRQIVGTEVGGLGYAFARSLAIEFDTYRDEDFLDPDSNHISVMVPTRFGAANSASHETSQIAITSDIPDLQEGTHTVRIEYETQNYDWQKLGLDFTAPMSEEYLTQHSVGRPGLLTIWFDGVRVIVLPLDLTPIVKPDTTETAVEDPPKQPSTSAYDELGQSPGRAWVGFTGSTNYDEYQAVDILSWRFQEKLPCPKDGRDAFCDIIWSPETPNPPKSVATYSTTTPFETEDCFWDGSHLCHLLVQNIARTPIQVLSHNTLHDDNDATICRNSQMQWNHLHPHFLGCARDIYFTAGTLQLWFQSVDGTRNVIIEDNQILQKAPSVFKRRNHEDSEQPWQWCVQEHPSDPTLFQFAECNCEYCVRQLDLQASYSIFYQQECSARFGTKCPCFEASESQHDSSTWQYQEPLKYMRLHICRGCAYHSQCNQALKVAVCEEPYQTYRLGNPLAPTILSNGFEDRLRDNGNVEDGKVRGDSCNCEPDIKPYAGSENSGMCKETTLYMLDTGNYPTLNDCAGFCSDAAQCTYFVYWDTTDSLAGDCQIYSVCSWALCSEMTTQALRDRCSSSSTYMMAPLGEYADTRGDVQRYNVFPRRTLQTNFDECEGCLYLYDEEYCYAQCGQASAVPYFHYPGGQACATCMFAGNRMHELTVGETTTVKECVYQAIRDSEDPWVACNETVYGILSVYTDDLFNGVATHFMTECPGRAFDDDGAVCVPNLYATNYFPLQILSRMAAKNDTVWAEGIFECLNGMCQGVPASSCYEKLATFNFEDGLDDEQGVVTGTRYGSPLPRRYTGYLTFLKNVTGYGETKQYFLTSPLPWLLENFTIEAWVSLGSVEEIENPALDKPVTANSFWYLDFLPEFAVDGDISTYWSSQLGEPGNLELEASLFIDLGTARYVGEVVIEWKEPAADYSILAKVEADDDWEEVFSVTGNSATTTEDEAFFEARYVRIYMTLAATSRDGLLTVEEYVAGIEPTRYPVFSIYEVELLKDNQISRGKPTNMSNIWYHAPRLATDGDDSTWWSPTPGTSSASLLIDLGASYTIEVFTLAFTYLPEIVYIYTSSQACGTCTWETSTGEDDIMMCSDGTTFDVTDDTTNGWSACLYEERGGRVQCPQNYPLMCADQCDTSGDGDWCCATDCSSYGGVRECSAEDAMPSIKSVASLMGDRVQESVEITTSFTSRCLRVHLSRVGDVYGEDLAAVQDVAVYADGDNVAPNSSVFSTLPVGANISLEAADALDDDDSTYWLVEPSDVGTVDLVVDLGESMYLMSVEVVFPVIDGTSYKCAAFSILIGETTSSTDMTTVQSFSGNTQMSRTADVKRQVARYVKLEVYQVYSTNPDGLFGLQDIRIRKSTENLANSEASTVYATDSWLSDLDNEFGELQNGNDYPHGPYMALDDDFDSWWGATLGVSSSASTGAGLATYEIILNEAATLGMAAIRWRYRATAVSVSCASTISSTWLTIGSETDIEDYITPVVFITSRTCKKVRFAFLGPVDTFAGQGIIGIREIELYNLLLDYALTSSSIDSNGLSGMLAVDSDSTTRWTALSTGDQNLTVDLGSITSCWTIRLLFPSSAVPKGFQIAIANTTLAEDGETELTWAYDENYTVIETFSDNTLPDKYIVTRFTARYVRVIFLATEYGMFAVRKMSVFGGTNFALDSTPVAEKSWNHSSAEVVDGDNETFWVAEPLSTAASLLIDLVDEYYIAGGVEIVWKFPAEDFEVLASSDGENFTTVVSFTGNLAKVTQISNCFMAQYISIRMTAPDRTNLDGAYGIYSVIIRFDGNLAHCKHITATHFIDSTMFLYPSANDGDESTIWMPYQGAVETSLVWDMEQDQYISGFELSWRYPPISFMVEYQDVDNLTNWIFVNQWGPNEDSPELPVDMSQEWREGFLARRMRITILEPEEHDEGLLVAMRDSILHYPDKSDNIILNQDVTVTNHYGEHIGSYITDGNERGTYWRAAANDTSSTILIEMPELIKTGDDPVGHDVGRIIILWRYEPGDHYIELYYDTEWSTVYEGTGWEFGYKTDCQFNYPATMLRLTVFAKDFNDPWIGILQVKAYRVQSMLVPAIEPPTRIWNASDATLMIDTDGEFSLDSDIQTYWMTPHKTDGAEVLLDLYHVYDALDMEVYFGFRPQLMNIYYAVDVDGPWTEFDVTSKEPTGTISLVEVGEPFTLRYLKVTIGKGYRDGEELFGTSIRDIGVYLFRNWARGGTATADSIWSYDPAWTVDSSNETRWVSRMGATEAELEIDMQASYNVAGMNFTFLWGCNYWKLSYSIDPDTYGWTTASEGSGEFKSTVTLPTTLQFKARYFKLLMQKPITSIYNPDTPGEPGTTATVFSLSGMVVLTHPGGGGVFGIQSLDGLEYTTLTYGLRQPGQWMLASEGQIFTWDIEEDEDYDFDTYNHWAITFQTVSSEGVNRDTKVVIYKNGITYGEAKTLTQPIDRLSVPNQTRLVLGVRSSAHGVEDANAWPPTLSGLDENLKEYTGATSWPDDRDPVKHGASHSPYFEGSIRRLGLISSALSAEEVEGLYNDVELGCHCYDACPTGENRFFPGVPVPCSGQGVCRRNPSGEPFAEGYCECMSGFFGDNCENHCTTSPSLGCCEANDDCPVGASCETSTKRCLSDS